MNERRAATIEGDSKNGCSYAASPSKVGLRNNFSVDDSKNQFRSKSSTFRKRKILKITRRRP